MIGDLELGVEEPKTNVILSLPVLSTGRFDCILNEHLNMLQWKVTQMILVLLSALRPGIGCVPLFWGCMSLSDEHVGTWMAGLCIPGVSLAEGPDTLIKAYLQPLLHTVPPEASSLKSYHTDTHSTSHWMPTDGITTSHVSFVCLQVFH